MNTPVNLTMYDVDEHSRFVQHVFFRSPKPSSEVSRFNSRSICRLQVYRVDKIYPQSRILSRYMTSYMVWEVDCQLIINKLCMLLSNVILSKNLISTSMWRNHWVVYVAIVCCDVSRNSHIMTSSEWCIVWRHQVTVCSVQYIQKRFLCLKEKIDSRLVSSIRRKTSTTPGCKGNHRGKKNNHNGCIFYS